MKSFYEWDPARSLARMLFVAFSWPVFSAVAILRSIASLRASLRAEDAPKEHS